MSFDLRYQKEREASHIFQALLGRRQDARRVCSAIAVLDVTGFCAIAEGIMGG